MGRLTLEIPLHHWKDFLDFCDFHYALADEVLKSEFYTYKYRRVSEEGKELWLDNSYNELKHSLRYDKMLEAALRINPTHIFTLEEADADKNLEVAVKSAARLRKDLPGVKLIACWRGNLKHLKALEEIAEVVALPYDEPRGNLLKKETAYKKYHYLGFNSVAEIRHRPPLSLDTSYPIRAALRGIKFDEATFRVKDGLGYYSASSRLTKDELELAKYNCKVLYDILHKKS